MTSYDFEIKELPDNLKCAKCQLVLKDACQTPCGCRFCRVCINDVRASGGQFCPGVSEECGESPLSLFSLDYIASKNVSRLTAKCAHNGCGHECELANMEEHFRECHKKEVECPFRELGCDQNKLDIEKIDAHLQHEYRKHSEILIGMITNINREIEINKQRDENSRNEIEMLKRRDENSRKEIEILKEKDENSKKGTEMLKLRNENNREWIDMLKKKDEKSRKEIEILKKKDEDSKKGIELLKQRDEASTKEIETIRRELLLKDKQINTIIDRMNHLENQNKSITRSKADLTNRVRCLAQQIDTEVDERREKDGLDMARLMDYIDKEIVHVTLLIESNRVELDKQIKSVINYISPTNERNKSTNNNMCLMTAQLQSKQVISTSAYIRYDWLIDDDLQVTPGRYLNKKSGYFTGAGHAYKYRLTSSYAEQQTAFSRVMTMLRSNTLPIRLLIYRGESKHIPLAWPFEGRVVITVADKGRLELSKSISQQCRIERPSANNEYAESDEFMFRHSELKKAGLILDHGLRVSCDIFPGPG